MRFPYTAIRSRLDAQAESQPGEREVKLGPPYLDTMALHLTRLEAGFSSAAKRSTANSIFAVIGGHGTSSIDDKEFEWRRRRCVRRAVLAQAHLSRVRAEFPAPRDGRCRN